MFQAALYALACALCGGIAVYLVVQRLFCVDSMKERGHKRPLRPDGQSARSTAGRVAEAVNRVLPQARADADGSRKRLAAAGVSMPPSLYHGIAVIFYVLAMTVSLTALLALDLEPIIKALLALLVGTVVLMLPRALLSARANARKAEIRATLPSTLEVIAQSILAGLTPQRAIRLVAQNNEGALASEFARVDEEMTFMRYSLAEALQNAADRCQVDEFSQFVAAVNVGSASGSKIADILMSQSKHFFKRRRQEIEEESNKLATKMLFPIAFFTLPATLIAFAAPMALTFMATMATV